jgi:hypothetical protein
MFRKSIEKIPLSLKSDKNNRYFTRRIMYIFIITCSFLFRMSNVWNKFVEKIKTHVLNAIIFFSKILPLWDYAKKYCRAGQTIDDAHAYCILDI